MCLQTSCVDHVWTTCVWCVIVVWRLCCDVCVVWHAFILCFSVMERMSVWWVYGKCMLCYAIYMTCVHVIKYHIGDQSGHGMCEHYVLPSVNNLHVRNMTSMYELDTTCLWCISIMCTNFMRETTCLACLGNKPCLMKWMFVSIQYIWALWIWKVRLGQTCKDKILACTNVEHVYVKRICKQCVCLVHAPHM